MSMDIREFPPILREYASYKRTIQGCSEKTVSEYLFDLRTFCRYLLLSRQQIEPTEEKMRETSIAHLETDFFASVTTLEIYEFLYYVDGTRGNENCAKSRKLSAIKMLYKYLTVKKTYFEQNPAANIESPKTRRALPKHLSVEESMDLLQAVQSDTDSRTRTRDHAILTLFLNCGMRLSELCGISLGDVDAELRSLRVLGKGAKERIIYLNDACREALLEYLPTRAEMHPRPEDAQALFLSGQGKRISPKTVQWMVKKYLGAAGLEYRHYSTHKLRHTAATLMYQTGEVDIRVLKDILGHEQLTTTQIYTHVSDKNMEEAMAKNPLASVHIAPAQKRLSDVDNEQTDDET